VGVLQTPARADLPLSLTHSLSLFPSNRPVRRPAVQVRVIVCGVAPLAAKSVCTREIGVCAGCGSERERERGGVVLAFLQFFPFHSARPRVPQSVLRSHSPHQAPPPHTPTRLATECSETCARPPLSSTVPIFSPIHLSSRCSRSHHPRPRRTGRRSRPCPAQSRQRLPGGAPCRPAAP
jgi:hypothetical protein